MLSGMHQAHQLYGRYGYSNSYCLLVTVLLLDNRRIRFTQRVTVLDSECAQLVK